MRQTGDGPSSRLRTGVFFATTSRAILRQTVAISRSRFRTPASFV